MPQNRRESTGQDRTSYQSKAQDNAVAYRIDRAGQGHNTKAEHPTEKDRDTKGMRGQHRRRQPEMEQDNTAQHGQNRAGQQSAAKETTSSTVKDITSKQITAQCMTARQTAAHNSAAHHSSNGTGQENKGILLNVCLPR